MEDNKIHYSEFVWHVPFVSNDTITVSYKITDVTCPICHYWFYKPEAMRLEQEYRAKNSETSGM